MLREEMEAAITEYGDMLYRLAIVRTGNVEEAEDMVQQTFLKLVEHYESLESPEHVKAWLIRVCCNGCSNLIKAPRKSRETDLEHVLMLLSDGVSQEDEVLKKLQHEQLWREVYKLPEKYRTVLHLCYMEEYSPTEIAEILKLNYNVVCVRLNRAKKKLAECLKREDFL